ncbi:MAG: hypothetical protein CMN76_11410 [Spirochaetaceae bacterium]|nr:hypothetical protein [Spirochaetaceae bacterium]
MLDFRSKSRRKGYGYRRFSEEQIFKILKEADAGTPVKELARKHGMSEQAFYRWKSKFSGMELSDMKKLRALEDENARLKKLVANQALEIDAIKLLLEKKF